MYRIIAPTLFHNKVCKLPGIGTLLMVAKPAHTDFVNARILPPIETIDFIPEINEEKIFNEFSAMSELLIKKLDEEGTVFLKGIGHFSKAADETISFSEIRIDPGQSVPAERVKREITAHSMLVGDQQTTNVQMTEFFSEKQPLKDRWKMIALAIFIIGFGLLIYYLSRYGFNCLGNTRSL